MTLHHGVLTEADVRAAQTIVDVWAAGLDVDTLPVELDRARWTQALLSLRGLTASQFADVRTAGYLEGVQRGRQETAHVVLDALHGEGLAP